MIPIQLVLSLILLFAISRVYLRLKDGALTVGGFLFWVSIFTLALVGVIEPQFTTYLAGLVGIGRGADAVIYTSIVLLFYLVFRTNILLENTRHDLTNLVQKIALNQTKHHRHHQATSSKRNASPRQ